MKRLRLCAAALLALTIASCDSPRRTIDRLRTDIAAYKASPSGEAEKQIDVEFQKLDAQIDDLETKGSSAEADGLRASEQNLRADYRAARMVRAMKDAQSAIRGIGDAFKDAGRSIGDAVRELKEPEGSTIDSSSP